MLGLRALGLVRRDLDPAIAEGTGLGERGQERLARGPVDRARERQPPGHALRRREQPRPEPAGGAQRDDVGRRPVGPGELARELEDAAHLGAAEGVDRLVRVTHDGEVAAVTGEVVQQLDLRRVGVLVLVDEDVREAAAQLLAVRLGLDHRSPDQVGVVGGALLVEVDEVLLEEQPGRDVLRQVVRLAQGSQRLAVEPLLAGAAEDRLHLVGEAAGAERPAQRVGPAHRLGRVGEQLAQHDVLLRRAEQAQRAGVQVRRGVLPDQPVGEGVERRARSASTSCGPGAR